MNLTSIGEVAFAQTLNRADIKWSRNKNRFEYIKIDSKKATYLLNFHIDDWKIYIETKGYETDLDRDKWSHFTESLIKILNRF